MPVVMAGETNGRKTTKLTQKQRKFALEYANNGGNSTKAALVAGYDAKGHDLETIGWSNCRNPKIQEEIHREHEAKMKGKLAGIAMGTLESILKDDKAPAPARVSAARFVLECAGHGRKGAFEEQRREEQDLESMSLSDLSEHLSRLQSQLDAASQAKPVIDVEAQPEAQEEPEAQ